MTLMEIAINGVLNGIQFEPTVQSTIETGNVIECNVPVSDDPEKEEEVDSQSPLNIKENNQGLFETATFPK